MSAATEARLPVEDPHTPRRQRIFLVLAIAMAMTMAAVAFAAIAVSRVAQTEQPRRAGTNGVFPSEVVATAKWGRTVCQDAVLPQGTGAIEVPLREHATPYYAQLVVRGADRTTLVRAASVIRATNGRFDLGRVFDHTTPVSVCLKGTDRTGEAVIGSLAQHGLTVDGRAAPGGLTLEYYRPGLESTYSIIGLVAERIGRARGAFGGSWRAYAAISLCLCGMLLAFGLALSARVRGSARRAAVLCAAVAVANSLAWSLLTPTMQIPDELSHLSYVQDLAEKQRIPTRRDPPALSPELNYVVGASGLAEINFNPSGLPPWSDDAEAAIEAGLAAGHSRVNPGSYPNVVDYPPLYYLALTPVYSATTAAGGNTLDAVTPLRAVSALFAAVTVVALFMLVLELFPGRVLLATGVSLVCAYQPVFTWITGGINADALFIALGAVLFWLFARAFNRGLSTPLAVGLGLTIAGLVLTKASGLGFLPGWAVGMGILLWRHPRAGRVRRAAVAALAAGGPVALFLALSVLALNRPLVPEGVETAASGGIGSSAGTAQGDSGFLSYLWQTVLPPVGSMTDFFKVDWTVADMWVPQWVGKFGWYDYQFPDSINEIALYGLGALVVAAVAAGLPVLRRQSVRRWQALVFLLLAGGLVVAIARVAYPLRAQGAWIFEQARYYMPLIGLYALALAFASRLVPHRARHAALVVVLAVAMAHLLKAFELTVQRYWL